MKTFILFLSFILTVVIIKAQTDTTTVIKTTTTSTAKPPASTNVNINMIDTSTKAQAAKNGAVAKPAFSGKEFGFGDWLLAFSPAIIFLIMMIVLSSRLRGFNLKEALQDDVQGKITVRNEQYTTANLQALKDNPAMTALLNPTIEISDGNYPKSSSRYIALITSALTWTIGICLTCYFIYGYILTGQPPELNKLTDVVLTLGIGVVPYAFNKLSEAVKK